MPTDMSGTTALTLLVVSFYLCGILARKRKSILMHALLMTSGFVGDMGLTIYLVIKIHVLGQFADPKQYVGALALLIVHTIVAVALLVGYGGTLWFAGKQIMARCGWKPENAEQRFAADLQRHRGWGKFTLAMYCITLVLIPSGGPVAWLLKNLFT